MAKVADLFLSFIVLCIVFEVVVISAKSLPSKDCSSLMYNMIDCLSFVSNDSKISKPEGTCCNGLKTVLKSDASCICEGFKSSSQFGIELNKTKAMSLPSKCGLIVPPSINNCGMSPAPSAAPAQSPSSVAPAVVPAGSSDDTDNVNIAPAPSSSGGLSCANSISVVVALLASLIAAAA